MNCTEYNTVQCTQCYPMNLCNELIKYWSFPVQLWMESQFVSHFSKKILFCTKHSNLCILDSDIDNNQPCLIFLILIRSFIINSYQSAMKLIFRSVDDALEIFLFFLSQYIPSERTKHGKYGLKCRMKIEMCKTVGFNGLSCFK